MTLEAVISEARSIARLQFQVERPTEGQVLETLAEMVSQGRVAYLAERETPSQLTGMCERCQRNCDDSTRREPGSLRPTERTVRLVLADVLERLNRVGQATGRRPDGGTVISSEEG